MKKVICYYFLKILYAEGNFGKLLGSRKYFDLTPKGKVLLKMIEPELDASKLRDVIDFEVDYIKKSYEKELSEKDTILAEKDKEIEILKDKLHENGIT